MGMHDFRSKGSDQGTANSDGAFKIPPQEDCLQRLDRLLTKSLSRLEK